MPYRQLIENIANELMANDAQAQFEAQEAGYLAKILLEELTGQSSASLLANRTLQIDLSQESKLANWISELRTGKPWQYVLGWAPFDDLRIPVRPGVLIPRPETEEIVAQAALWLNNRLMDLLRKDKGFDPTTIKVLDICTGSGCIPIALKHRFPQLTVLATDFDETALDIAKANAALLSADINIFRHDALTEEPIADHGSVTLIISNPPYVLPSEAAEMASNVLDHEPEVALFVPEEDPLLFYRHIVRHAQTLLGPGGSLWLECNERYCAEVKALLEAAGFAEYHQEADFRGRMRLVWGIL